jgi:hypothetical protein
MISMTSYLCTKYRTFFYFQRGLDSPSMFVQMFLVNLMAVIALYAEGLVHVANET